MLSCERSYLLSGDENLNRQLILLKSFCSNHSLNSRANRASDCSLFFKIKSQIVPVVGYFCTQKSRDKCMSKSWGISRLIFWNYECPKLTSKLLSYHFFYFSPTVFIRETLSQWHENILLNIKNTHHPSIPIFSDCMYITFS